MEIFVNIFNWLIVFGCFFSFVPQYIKIFQNKNTLGISETMIISGIYSCYFNLIGTYFINYEQISNYSHKCYTTVLSLLQFISLFLSYFILYVFFVCYYNNKHINEFQILDVSKMMRHIKRKKRLRYRFIFISFNILLLSLAAEFTSKKVSVTEIENLGKILNTASALISLIMWIPQILTTYNMKINHSLSLLMLMIHALGCLVIIIFQLIIYKQVFWIILCYAVSLLSEVVLAIMIIYYKYKIAKKKKIERFIQI